MKKVAKIRDAFRVDFKKPRGALFWTIAYVVGMFIYTALLFGLSIGAVGGIYSFKNSDDYAFAQELLINWNKNYISDITVIKANEVCPAGYQLWHDRTWPGIVEGCNCINNNGGFRKLVTRTACTPLQLNSKCEKVEALDPVTLDLWKQDSKVCLLRQDVSFLNSPENCGSGLKRCGQGKVRFCVEEDQPCPITDVVISGDYEKTGYEKVILSDTENIFFKRNDTNFPISAFRLTEAGFCIFDAKDNISPGRLDYILSRSLRRRCIRDETRFETLDSQGEKFVYQQNNLYTTLRAIPGYPLPSNDFAWNLGFVRYFEWDDLCRNGPYSLKQVESKIELSTVLKAAWITFGVTMVSILITGIILPVRHLKRRIREEHIKAAYAKKKKDAPKQDYKKILTSAPYLTDKIFKLILLPVVILAIFFTQRENKWFMNVQANSCGDEVTNSYFQTFADKLEDILAVYITLIFIWAICLAVDMVHAMYLILKSNIAIWKFFESKIRRDEEKIVIVTEDELRGLNNSSSSSSRPDSRSKVMPVGPV